MAHRYARACVVVSNNFFKQYKQTQFGNKNVNMDLVSPNKFVFSSVVYDNEYKSIVRVTNAALSVYNRAHNDFMPCIEEIKIENVHISNIIHAPEPLRLNYPVLKSTSFFNKSGIFDDPIRISLLSTFR